MKEGQFLKGKNHVSFRMILFLIAGILIAISFSPLSLSQQFIQTATVNHNTQATSMAIDGQILYSPMYSGYTYLRQGDGSLNHTWSSSYLPGCMVRWLSDGSILRTIRVGVGPGQGGAGGGVQIVNWDGTVSWDYRYNTNGDLSHHDTCMLPNGNVLLIAWETKTRDQAIAMGRNPSYVGSQGLMPDHIIEVQPTGPSSGTIVWEWHAWDHLIQHYDSSKPNYGVISDHPELIDINFVTSSLQDLMHTNSIDYNEKFDQIVISVRYYSEVWVIDHSTTTAEAASHSGGKGGKGGDLLYRWGNPQAYGRGTSSDRKLYEQHDTNWIDDGLPGAGNILIFNNGVGRAYSTIDEIVPPVDANGVYYLAQGAAYGPSTQIWSYNPTPKFYASHLSGVNRLKNGNTLICNGESGKLWEVTTEGTTVWQYNLGVELLKIEYIPPVEQQPPENKTPDLDCIGSLSWANVQPGATVTGSFQVQNIGDSGSLLNWTVNISLLTWGTWTITPDSGEHLTPEDGSLTVHVSVIAPTDKNTDFEGYLRVENQNDSSDFENIPISLKTHLDSSASHFNTAFQSLLLLKFRQWSTFIDRLLLHFSAMYFS